MGKHPDIRIDSLQFSSASSEDLAGGILGWITFNLNGSLRLDGLTIRRTRKGRRILTFPGKTDASGQQQYFVRPLNNETRLDIERQVFEALGEEATS